LVGYAYNPPQIADWGKLTKETEMSKKKREIVIVASKLKDAVRGAGCQSSGDLVEAVSDKVHDMVEAAINRAKSNGRATVRSYDL